MITLPRHRTVADVMTTRVHVASPETPFKLLVRLIEENRISAVPIVDHNGIPVGGCVGVGPALQGAARTACVRVRPPAPATSPQGESQGGGTGGF